MTLEERQALIVGSLSKITGNVRDYLNIEAAGETLKISTFNTLIHGFEAASLAGSINDASMPFTIFAPSDAAFAQLPEGTVEDLLKPENKEKLISVLTTHVVAERITTADFRNGLKKEFSSMQGTSLTIESNNGVTINGVKITEPDILVGGSVVHVIDSALLPKN